MKVNFASPTASSPAQGQMNEALRGDALARTRTLYSALGSSATPRKSESRAKSRVSPLHATSSFGVTSAHSVRPSTARAYVVLPGQRVVVELAITTADASVRSNHTAELRRSSTL